MIAVIDANCEHDDARAESSHVTPAEPKTRFVDDNYPYDPGARIELLTNLDKLRAIADRALAADMALLYGAIVNRPLQARRGQLLLPLKRANG